MEQQQRKVMTLLEAVNTGATLTEDQIDCLITVIAGNCSPVTKIKLANRLRNTVGIRVASCLSQVEIDERSASFERINDYRSELLAIRRHLLRGRLPGEVNLTMIKLAIARFSGLKKLPSASACYRTIEYLRSTELTEAEQQLFKELKL